VTIVSSSWVVLRYSHRQRDVVDVTDVVADIQAPKHSVPIRRHAHARSNSTRGSGGSLALVYRDLIFVRILVVTSHFDKRPDMESLEKDVLVSNRECNHMLKRVSNECSRRWPDVLLSW